MARSLLRHALATLAALTLAACESATSSTPLLDIAPDRTQYAPGSEVNLTVRNLGDQPVKYTFCGRVIQRLTATGWITTYGEFILCAPPQESLAPGALVTESMELPANIPAGTYRVYLPGIASHDEDEAAANRPSRQSSKPFEVRVLAALQAH
ncbi:MAG TPA: hypothetical protein VFS20_02180 [Longimicrobium sp.]|nr:hypothetical protein [Longimicrobium sp.]